MLAVAAAALVPLACATSPPAALAGKAASKQRAAATPRDHEADGRLGEWRGRPTMLAGRSQISRGELIYTDYLYDDYGPDLNGHYDLPQFRSELAPRSGDYEYPDEPRRYGYNAADLRELRVAVDAHGAHLLVALQTMLVPDAAIVTVALDADGKESTGPDEWPDGVGLPGRGADLFVTVSGDAARLSDGSGAPTRLDAAVNARANAIEVEIPRRLLGNLSVAGSRASYESGALAPALWVVAGLANGDGGYLQQQTGETAAFDSAFQGAETYRLDSHWSDAGQSRALARGDLTQLTGRLPLRLLRAGATRRFRLEPGYYNAIFRSRFPNGEGIDLKTSEQEASVGRIGAGSPRAMFRGRFQPYGLYIPHGYSRRSGASLVLNGHSLDLNHNEYAVVAPRSLRQLGDERGSVIVTPLARGTDTWYLDAGLVDVFEAWRDVRRRFRTDPDRTAISGYSMGGYMTYRLGLLKPDAFTRASVYVGPPAYYYWPHPLPLQSTPKWEVRANTNRLVENALNLPFEINHGNGDELVPIGGVLHQVESLREAGAPYRFYHHQADEHFSFIFTDQWAHTARWFGDARRELSPVTVRYRRYPAMDLPDAGLRFDGAYWVDRLRVRDADQDADSGMVDATTFALGGHLPRLVDDGTTASAGEGGASPARVTGQHYESGEAIEERNAFELRLDNLRRIELRSARMGLDAGRSVRATLRGDGRTVLRLTGGWPDAPRALLDGEPVRVRRGDDGSIALPLELATGRPHMLAIHAGARHQPR